MMGGAAPSADFPVLKQNNGLLLFSKQAATLPEPSACIRCGRCIEACPWVWSPWSSRRILQTRILMH